MYDKLIDVRFRWGGIGSIKRREIKSKITIIVKTLHGERKQHRFQVSILDKVSKLRDLLLQTEPEEIGGYFTMKFIWPMGQLKTLNMEQTFS